MFIHHLFGYAVLGAVFGSFLNVCMFRLPRGLSPYRGRSQCPYCHHQLQVLDLIPLVSWLILKGRCRYCHHPISIRYPLMELFHSTLWVVVCLMFEPSLFTMMICIFLSLLMYISIYDWDYMQIPLSAFIALCICGTLLWIYTKTSFISSLGSAIIISLPLWMIGHFFPNSIGEGDICLLALAGFMLGFPGVLIAFLIGCLSALIHALPQVWQHHYGFKTALPMIPFFSLGIGIMLLFGSPILHWYLQL